MTDEAIASLFHKPRRLVEATADDHELLERGMAIFEGLYAVLKRKA
jgi:hypothetical protein